MYNNVIRELWNNYEIQKLNYCIVYVASLIRPVATLTILMRNPFNKATISGNPMIELAVTKNYFQIVV